MKQYTAGFLGAGNMGGALAQAAIRTVGAENVILTCKTEAHTRAAAERLGCASGQAAEIIRSSRFVFLGVKPQMLSALAEELGGVIGEAECVLVSMLAGVTLERLEALFPGKRILRIMPNTPCAVGSGMLFLCRGSLAAEQDAKAFRQLMACAGRIDEIPEKWMDAASAVAGCGPAFVAMMLEALADAAVKHGVPRALAYELASQMTVGAATLQLKTGAHPGQLKDAVCSPGGSTIRGVQALEKAGMRAAFMDAVDAVMDAGR